MGKPLLFNAPMVRALLDGTKTQTRRILKPDLLPSVNSFVKIGKDTKTGKTIWETRSQNKPVFGVKVGHGCLDAHVLTYAPGDRLWVKETWRTWRDCDRLPPNQLQQFGSPICYEADTENTEPKGKVLVSIHMPRWASRLTLTVTDVRVERLQSISEADAEAEGVERVDYQGAQAWKSYETYPDGSRHPHSSVPNRLASISYRELWNSIKGAGAWEQNPWVVALTFTVEQRNIDAGKASVA